MAILYKCNLRVPTEQKHCEVIMDHLLLFTPMKKANISKLEDLLKALLKKTRYLQESVSYSKQNYSIWVTLYLLKIGKFALNH